MKDWRFIILAIVCVLLDIGLLTLAWVAPLSVVSKIFLALLVLILFVLAAISWSLRHDWSEK